MERFTWTRSWDGMWTLTQINLEDLNRFKEDEEKPKFTETKKP